MSNKFKTIIYPFDINSVSLLRHKQLIDSYEFVGIVSPNGFGLTMKDASKADYGENIGLTVENDFNKALIDCDTVLFVKPDEEFDFNTRIYPKMIKAAESSKNIICSIKLDDNIKKTVSDICKRSNKTFRYIFDENENMKRPLTERLFTIDTPIIFVASLSERTNKFEVQVNLREKLIGMGYKVSQIGTRNYCELMGFHSFPQFMFEKNFYDWEKITLFNHYVKKIEKIENPDVIVIGIPGGTLPLNDIFTNKFGILAHEISNAVTPDVTVLSTLYQDNLNDKYFNIISKEHEHKFGFSVDCYNISNTKYNHDFSEALKKLQYITIDYNHLSEKIKSNTLKTPIFNILNNNDVLKMTNLLIDKLAEYAE